MFAMRCVALALALLLAAPACRAAEATPDQARVLEAEIRDWIGAVLGPAIRERDRPVQLRPEGDHYAVSVPLGAAPDAPSLTATARMLEGGRWSVEDIRVPSPAELKLHVPEPGQDRGTPPALMPMTYEITIGQQAGQILFDPAYTTQSTLTASLRDVDVTSRGGGMTQSSHLDRTSSTSTLRPVGQDRVDLLTDGTLEGYSVASRVEGEDPLRIAMGRVRVTGELDGVSRQRGVQLLQALIQVGATLQTAGAGGPGAAIRPRLDDSAARNLLDALGDLASGLSIEETIEKLAVSYGDRSGLLNLARLGLTARSDQGLLDARMDLALEGLALPDLPLGAMAALIPARVALRPALTGVPVAALVRLAKTAQQGGAPAQADIEALFAKGPVTVGLESFEVDVGGTVFAGMGKLVLTSPELFTGTAQITATNFDLLQRRVAASPELASALPAFIFAKGIGRIVENRMVWDVTYRNGRLLVNDQDLTAMTGSAAPDQGGPKAPPRPKLRPSRP